MIKITIVKALWSAVKLAYVGEAVPDVRTWTRWVNEVTPAGRNDAPHLTADNRIK
jgi:hypothetical protein